MRLLLVSESLLLINLGELLSLDANLPGLMIHLVVGKDKWTGGYKKTKVAWLLLIDCPKGNEMKQVNAY